MKKVNCLIVGSGLAGVTIAWKLYQKNISFHIISNPHLSSSSIIAPGIINPIVFKRMIPSWNITELLSISQSFYRNIEQTLQQKIFENIQIAHCLHSDDDEKLWKEKHFFYPQFIGEITTLNDLPIKNIKQNFKCGMVLNAARLKVSEYIYYSLNYFKNINAYSEEKFYHENLLINEKILEYNQIIAEKIIFCEGYQLQHNPFFQHISLKPAKGELVEISTPHPIMPENIVLHYHLNIIPNSPNKYLIGSNYEWQNIDEYPTQNIREKFLSVFDSLFDVSYDVIGHYAGVRPASLDRRPIIQQHPEFSNLFTINGFGTKGVMLAPYAADELLKSLF